MKSELISSLLVDFEFIRQESDGVEFWSVRDLQKILWYAEWRNFEKSVLKAVESCKNASIEAKDHFVESNKMVDLWSGAERAVSDILLTRYAT